MRTARHFEFGARNLGSNCAGPEVEALACSSVKIFTLALLSSAGNLDRTILNQYTLMGMSHASRVTILTHEHIFRDPVNSALPLHKPVTIGKHTFVGVGAFIMPGVSIGEQCIIAAGALVTKDVEPCSMVAGVPARKIRSGIKMKFGALYAGD